MCHVFNGATACLLAEHLNHVDRFLLLRQVCCGSRCNKVVGIGSHVNRTFHATYVHPQASQELARSKALHEAVELSYGGAQCGPPDLGGLVVHQTSSCAPI